MEIHPFRRGMAAALLAVCLLLLSVPSAAQERFGEINGTATDPTGAVLPDVAVTATNTSTQRAFTTRTSSDGTYVVRQLEPGAYSIRFERTGFTAFQVARVDLAAGKILKVNASMNVAGTEQAVQVTDAAPLIDTTRTM